MKHKHHIIPKHMGGTDDESNLIELTVEEHAQAHKFLYELHGKKEDLCAYYMLSGRNQDPGFVRMRASLGGKASQEKRKSLGLKVGFANMDDNERFEASSKGGKIQGKINTESGHMKRIQSLSDVVESGKKGGKRTIELGIGAFGNTEERLKSASMGGKIQGRINSESGHLEKISKDYWKKVKTGQIQRKRKIWIHNEQLKKSVLMEEGSELPEGFVIGRKIKF